ncbi:transcriptional regulator [Mangrovactinospora gilvigrisea]|uniref:Transcriptional regulator n=1 Tax=Mangrovactinospora gilvigrisea TaxID=1428644 RepID=A0A1J7BBF3_9ACTN|nr:transcriptional regulator [Mangrovactinospora gilvigrisea]
MKIGAIIASLFVLVVAGCGAFVYEKLNGNIKGSSLFNGTSGDAGSEKPDAYGRTPINILAIGSDGRSNKADCKIGGDCGPGQNADVQMVVHISADRSNATVMSIPRDLKMQLPACKDPDTKQSFAGGYDKINASLQYGPGCTVAAVHQLTGIPIDHFAMVDFQGVIKMSDAVGGVQVCVSDNVYDTYSHLKLKKGDHTLQNLAALEFVRSRHAFGTGTDIGRTYAQHLFLSSLMRKMKGAGTLANPTKLYSLANAATNALTVDNGIKSITKLVGLGEDVNKVPSDRMTFVTMQNQLDDAGNVHILPAAYNLFNAIKNDQSLTTSSGGKSKVAASATGKASPSASAGSSVDRAKVSVTVENGIGPTARGRASTVQQALTAQGFAAGGTANATQTASTTLWYGPGEKAEAQAAADALGLPSSHLKQGSSAGLVLVVGTDWPTGTSYPGGTGSGSGSDSGSGSGSSGGKSGGSSSDATDGAHAQTAGGKSSGCAPVSRFKTVSLNGVPMTPTQAYAEAKDKPDSAP